MSRFYGQVEGMAETIATRRGSNFIKSSAQSWDGSVITRLSYDENDVLKIQIELSDKSSFSGGWSIPSFYGTLEELKELFYEYNHPEIVETPKLLPSTIVLNQEYNFKETLMS